MRETIDRTINTVNGIYVIPAIVKPIASGSWVPVTHIGIIDDKGKATCLCGQALVDEREGTHSEYNNVVYDPDNGIDEIECQKCIRALAWMKKVNNFDSSDALVRHLSHVLGEKAENRQYHTPREVSPSETSNTTHQEQEPVERRGILIIEKPVEKIVEKIVEVEVEKVVEVEKIVEVEKVVEVRTPVTELNIMNYLRIHKHVHRAKLIMKMMALLDEPTGMATDVVEALRLYEDIKSAAWRIGEPSLPKPTYYVQMFVRTARKPEGEWNSIPTFPVYGSRTSAEKGLRKAKHIAANKPDSPLYGFQTFRISEVWLTPNE